jgi:hypothetical protein
VKVTELAAFMVLPVYYTHQCTLGMVLDGPFAGQEVNITQSLVITRKPTLVPATKPVIGPLTDK